MLKLYFNERDMKKKKKKKFWQSKSKENLDFIEKTLFSLSDKQLWIQIYVQKCLVFISSYHSRIVSKCWIFATKKNSHWSDASTHSLLHKTTKVDNLNQDGNQEYVQKTHITIYIGHLDVTKKLKFDLKI